MPIGMRDRPPREKKAAPTDTARNGGTASLSLPYRHPFSFAKRLPNGKPQRQATFDRNGVAVTNPVGQRATVETNRPPPRPLLFRKSRCAGPHEKKRSGKSAPAAACRPDETRLPATERRVRVRTATNARCRTPSDALHPESGMFSAPNEASIPRDSPDNRVTGPPSPTGPDRDSPDRSSDTNRSRTNPDRPRRTRQVGSSRARTKGAPPLRSLRTPAPHPAAAGPLSTHRKRRINTYSSMPSTR